MFFASFRLRKSVLLIIIFATVVFGVLIASFIKAANDLNKNADTLSERVDIASVYGYDISSAEESEAYIDLSALPEDVFSEYNAVQKICGFDLADYSDKTVLRYSYVIENGKLEIGILTYKGKLIGGDVFSVTDGEYLSLTFKRGE